MKLFEILIIRYFLLFSLSKIFFIYKYSLFIIFFSFIKSFILTQNYLLFYNKNQDYIIVKIKIIKNFIHNLKLSILKYLN